MTSEQRVALIQKILILLLFVGIAIAAWNYQGPVKKHAEKPVRKTEQKSEQKSEFERAPVKPGREKAGNPVATGHVKVSENPPPEQIESIFKNVTGPARGVAIIHCHLPGDPASEQLADTFNRIQKKYGTLVVVTRVGFPAQPTDWQAQKGIKLPYVMMILGKENVFQFQGLWSYSQVDKKVEEVIFGLRRASKDWRPVVPGMTPKNR